VRRRADEKQGRKFDKGKLMPLQYMLRIMRNVDLDPHVRFQAAARAAPYVHPQLQAIAHQHLDQAGNPIAPMVTVTIMKADLEPEKPRLTLEGPKETDKVQ
jgi:hypothetical protein